MQGGKLNRGLALVESYTIFTNGSEAETTNAVALGWALEVVCPCCLRS